MEVAAQLGDRFLITVGEHDGLPVARVYDRSVGKVTPPLYLASFLARGYWEDPVAPADELQQALERVAQAVAADGQTTPALL
jgi:hypothetical protein